MNVIPYTAITGNRDPARTDILCFTDRDFGKFISPCMNAKIFKVLAHQFLRADVSIWMDGYVRMKKDKQVFVDMMGDADLLIFTHPRKKNIREHARDIQGARPHQAQFVEQQIQEYLRNGLNPEDGVYWGGFLVRRHTDATRDFNRRWWEEICRWSERDQISLTYVLRECSGLKVRVCDFAQTADLLDIKWHESGCLPAGKASLVSVGEYLVDGSLLGKGGISLEIGARSLNLAGKMIGLGLRHIICEPDPTVKLGEVPGLVRLSSAVVGEGTTGLVEMSLTKNPVSNYLSISGLKEGKEWPVAAKIMVATTTIREIMCQMGVEKFDLIAMDCEGAEEQILLSLKGGEARQIVTEVHTHRGQTKERIAKIVEHLRSVGYVERHRWRVGNLVDYILFVSG